tara:strand:- start:69 stop:749 length:681 start_codon:yes stop_codon:yes gene_type:complete
MKLHLLIPDSLEDITLEQYQKFEKLNTKENQNSVFLMQKMIEIFCDVEFDLTLGMKYKDLTETVSHINNILNSQPDLQTVFKLNKKEFGFIPNLDDITLGEYIDLDNYLGKWQTMNKAMSVLYRPVTMKKGDRYLIEQYKGSKYSDEMKKSPLSVCIGAMIFFYNLNNELLSHTLNYLKRELGNNLTSEQLVTLEKNGDGISQSLHSLEEILKDLRISPNSKRLNV